MLDEFRIVAFFFLKKHPLTFFVIHDAAVHPPSPSQCILCWFRAVVLLLLASCLVLRVSCFFLQGRFWLLDFSCWIPFGGRRKGGGGSCS